MINVWCEYKKLKENFPINTQVILRLEPSESFLDLLWAKNEPGVVIGYNITFSLVIILLTNGGIAMQCSPGLLEKIPLVSDGWD
jgi:hypothetical protein